MRINLGLIHPFCFIQSSQNGSGCISLPCSLKPCISSRVFLPFTSSHCFTPHTVPTVVPFPTYLFWLSRAEAKGTFWKRCRLLSVTPILIFTAKILYGSNWYSKLTLCSLLIPSGGLSNSPLPCRFSLWKHLLISRLCRPLSVPVRSLWLRGGENIPLQTPLLGPSGHHLLPDTHVSRCS